MDKKTGIAVAVALVVIFIIFGGYGVISGMFGGSSAGNTSNINNNANTQTTDNNGTSTPDTTTMQNPTQLEMQDVVVGTGTAAVAGNTVTVNYTGKLTDGTVFDSSLNPGRTPFTFTLDANPPQVIQGWDMGVAGMKVGGTRILLIPASLGYGAQANGPIPANSTLVFEVQLLSVK